MSKNNFFYIGRGCSRDHLGPHKTQKKLEKRAENEPKTAQDRPRSAAPRPEAYFNIRYYPWPSPRQKNGLGPRCFYSFLQGIYDKIRLVKLIS